MPPQACVGNELAGRGMSETAAFAMVSQLLHSFEPPIDRPFDELMMRLKSAEHGSGTCRPGHTPANEGTQR